MVRYVPPVTLTSKKNVPQHISFPQSTPHQNLLNSLLFVSFYQYRKFCQLTSPFRWNKDSSLINAGFGEAILFIQIHVSRLMITIYLLKRNPPTDIVRTWYDYCQFHNSGDLHTIGHFTFNRFYIEHTWACKGRRWTSSSKFFFHVSQFASSVVIVTYIIDILFIILLIHISHSFIWILFFKFLYFLF